MSSGAGAARPTARTQFTSDLGSLYIAVTRKIILSDGLENESLRQLEKIEAIY